MVSLLAFDKVRKRHHCGGRQHTVFECVDLDVRAGDAIGVWGPPRTGKSSLLRLAAGIELADGGSVCFQGQDYARLASWERASLLRSSIGFAAPLDERMPAGLDRSPDATAFVAGPLLSGGWRRLHAEQQASELLTRVGARSYAADPPALLSPAQRTRVGLARALIRQPTLLLVDEPALSASVDEREAIRQLLHTLVGEMPLAMIVASSDVDMLRGFRRVFSAGDGRLLSSERPGRVIPFPCKPSAEEPSES